MNSKQLPPKKKFEAKQSITSYNTKQMDIISKNEHPPEIKIITKPQKEMINLYINVNNNVFFF